jgi:quinol monooxygenase YgiN
VPTYDRVCKWVTKAIEGGGAQVRLGAKLGAVFRKAGLREPALRLESVIGSGDGARDAIHLVTDLFPTLLPTMERLGIVTESEIGLPSLVQRILDEVGTDGALVGRAEPGPPPDRSAAKNMITLINVFTVAPENQARLIDLLTRATDGLVDRAPGFISATLHRGTDGTKVTMVARWRSTEDYQAMRQDPRPLPFLQEALTFATFEPGMYEVVRTFSPPQT